MRINVHTDIEGDGAAPREVMAAEGEFSLDGLRYRSDELRFINDEWSEEARVQVQVDPDNVEKAFFLDPMFDVWRRALCVHGQYARGLTRKAHLAIVEDFVTSNGCVPPWDLDDAADYMQGDH